MQRTEHRGRHGRTKEPVTVKVLVKRQRTRLGTVAVLLACNVMLGLLIFIEYHTVQEPQVWRPWPYAKDFLTLEVALCALLSPAFRRRDFRVHLDPTCTSDTGQDTGTLEATYRLHASSSSKTPPLMRVTDVRPIISEVIDVEDANCQTPKSVDVRVEPENIRKTPCGLPTDLALVIGPSDSATVPHNSHPWRCTGIIVIEFCVCFSDGSEMVEVRVPVNSVIG